MLELLLGLALWIGIGILCYQFGLAKGKTLRLENEQEVKLAQQRIMHICSILDEGHGKNLKQNRTA